jgi:uncharacterized protein YkwD
MSRRALLLGIATGWSCRQAAPGSSPAGADRVTEIEWHIRFLSNQQRQRQKLAPLEPSAALADVARAHSRDMLERGFFDHRNPEGLSPRDRVVKRGLTFPIVAENIYSTRDGTTDPAELAALMVDGWMKAEGHRRNILEPRLKYLGVGIALSDHLVLATQLFAG